MVAFNESKGPYKARLVFYRGKNDSESIVFPGLGDRALNMLVAGPGFRAEWAKQLGINEDYYGQMNFDANADERETRGLISMAMISSLSSLLTANCTLHPPAKFPILRIILMAIARIFW